MMQYSYEYFLVSAGLVDGWRVTEASDHIFCEIVQSWTHLMC